MKTHLDENSSTFFREDEVGSEPESDNLEDDDWDVSDGR